MESAIDVHRIALPRSDDWIGRVRQKVDHYVRAHHSCAQSILAAFMEELEIEDPLVLASAGSFHAGMSASLTCGIYTGALMVLGLLMGRDRIEQGMDGLLPIMAPAQELIGRLQQRMGSTSCWELTRVDFTDPNQAMAFLGSEGPERCATWVADGAEELARFLRDLNERGELFRPQLERSVAS